MGKTGLIAAIAIFLNATVVSSTMPVLEVIDGPKFAGDGRSFNITITWKDVVYVSAYDYVAVSGCIDVDCVFPEAFYKAPIQYKNVRKPRNEAFLAKHTEGFRSDDGVMLRGSPYINKDHIMNFTVLVRADIPAYQVAYVSGTRQYPEIDALSLPIKIPPTFLHAPKNFRLSVVNDLPNSMRLMWTESTVGKGESINKFKTRVRYGLNPNHLTQITSPVLKYTFNKDNLCEPDLFPAGSYGFSNLGTQAEAILTDLTPDAKYYYKVEFVINGNSYLSNINYFVNNNYWDIESKQSGARMIVFGDMGQSMQMIDGSLQHSFDNNNQGEIAAQYTARLLESLIETQNIDVINHIGDISYATGQLSLWDTFLYEVEHVSSKIPWMTGIGNHEMGSTNSFVVGSDSLGECGVPYMSLFPFSQRHPLHVGYRDEMRLVDYFAMDEIQAKKAGLKSVIEPYYSYRMKNVFVLIISTEHDLRGGSEQLLWIESELKKARSEVDDLKSSISWIMVLGHRPMYISDKYMDPVQRHLRKFVEPLMNRYKVDIGIWGHHHSYQRFKCKMAAGKCNTNGVAQIVSGHAGFAHSSITNNPEYNDLFAVRDNQNWGISILDFVSDERCFVQYVENKGGKVIDSFWIDKSKMMLEDE